MAPDPIFISNTAGSIVVLNRQAEEQFGYTREELLGQSIDVLVPDRVRAQHEQHRNDYCAAPRTRPMGVGLELYARRKDGTDFPVEISLSPLRQGNGQVLVTSIIRDISERKRVEEELKRAATALEAQTKQLQLQAEQLKKSNIELQQFAFIASHDLQEPLRMVASFTQLLARKYQGRLDDEADKIIGFAVDGAKRMQALINDLLAYSRVGNGPQLEAVDCQALMSRIVTDLASTIEESQGKVLFAGLPVVLGDPRHLGQLFQNLISNALKFHGEIPPRVEVAARRRDDDWLFSVKDNGIGIEPEYAERVFIVFQRLHTTAEYPGTGIGLAICKKVVEQHGGQIWFESHPGKGATFFFTLRDAGLGTT